MTVVAAVVFDVDGTLFDHRRSARAGLQAWLEEQGVVLSADLEQAWFDAEDRHFRAWREGVMSFAEHRRRRLRDVLPMLSRPLGTDAELDGVFAGYLSAYERAWVGFSDVDDALTVVHAQGLVSAVLTNGTEQQQRAKLARLGLLERVGHVFTSEGLGVAKPHVEAFRLVCDALRLPPGQVLYVGDDHELDVLAARAAGLLAVHLDRSDAGPHTESQRIGSLRELAQRVTSTP